MWVLIVSVPDHCLSLYLEFYIKVCDKCFTISVFSQSLQWILFVYGVTIEPCLKFYAVPSPSQYMTLKSRL